MKLQNTKCTCFLEMARQACVIELFINLLFQAVLLSVLTTNVSVKHKNLPVESTPQFVLKSTMSVEACDLSVEKSNLSVF